MTIRILSAKVKEHLRFKILNADYFLNLQDIGKVGIRKVVDFIMLLRRIRKSLKEIRPDLVYVTPNACGGAFYKDYIVKGIKVILLSECLDSDVMKYVIMCE